MKKVLLPLYKLISDINDRSDAFDEWGQWFVSYHFLYLMEGNKTDLQSLLESIMTTVDAKDILDTHAVTFKLIETTAHNFKDVIVDYEANHLGLQIIRRDL